MLELEAQISSPITVMVRKLAKWEGKGVPGVDTTEQVILTWQIFVPIFGKVKFFSRMNVAFYFQVCRLRLLAYSW